MEQKRNKVNQLKRITSTICILLFLIIGIYANRTFEVQEEKNNNSEIIIGIENIPKYTDKPYIVLNNNIPNFDEELFNTKSFEKYSELDELKRSGVALANLGKETMPDVGEKREQITHIRPVGLNKNKKYDESIVEDNFLYNRCHLIAFSLSAENDNEKNLMTGTKYFNKDGMLPFEVQVTNYLRKNKSKHVLYRVTPIYQGDNIIADGVQMEAMSVEDRGKSICFNVFVYNVQPGVEIDYLTGNNRLKNEN